jgi:predicted dehydrogenase
MMMWRSTRSSGGNPTKGTWDALASEDNWYPVDIARFIDSLDTGTRAEITAEEAVGSLAVLMAAYESAATGTSVSVPKT